MGLKSVVGSLLEARSAGGATRPNETNTPNNRRRKTYSALYTYQQFLDYQHENERSIERAIEKSIKFQRSNRGRIVFRGSYPIPAYPPRIRARARRRTSPAGGDPRSAAVRLPARRGASSPGRSRTAGRSASAWPRTASSVLRASGDRYWVPMRQAQRGLIPLLLDGEAAEPMVAAQRVTC